MKTLTLAKQVVNSYMDNLVDNKDVSKLALLAQKGFFVIEASKKKIGFPDDYKKAKKDFKQEFNKVSTK